MKILMLSAIAGKPEDVQAMLEIFGEVAFNRWDFGSAEKVHFTITTVLPNYYCDWNAEENKSPLYVLVPNMEIDLVWPGCRFDEVRFGKALDRDGKTICPAIAVLQGHAGLYFCLNPNGVRIKEIGALGI